MLHSHGFSEDGVSNELYTFVLETKNFPDVLQFWMAHVTRDLLRLGAYFRAAALLRELPGGTRYQPVTYDAMEPRGLDGEDHPRCWLKKVSYKIVLDVLAECLRRLGAIGFMKRVPGGADHKPRVPSDEWTAYIDRHAKVKHGLLNLVAACLDELIVVPEWEAIDAAPRVTWWQQWWSRMEE